LEIVDDESKITVDMIVCGGVPDQESSEEASGKTIENILRSRDIHSSYHGGNTVIHEKATYPDVNFRYLIYETHDHASGISELEFNGDKTWPLQLTGRQDAYEVLTAGVSTHFELLDNWGRSKELRDEFPSFKNFLASLQ